MLVTMVAVSAREVDEHPGWMGYEARDGCRTIAALDTNLNEIFAGAEVADQR